MVFSLTVPRLALLALLMFSPSAPAQPIADDAPFVGIGDRSLRGKKLKAFDALWSASGNPDGPPIHEVAEISTSGGGRTLTRTQVWPMKNGLSKHSEIVIDLETMATRSLTTKVLGLPEGAGLGQLPTYRRWEFDGAAYTLTTRIKGEEQTREGELDAPMFDGNALGLALAALPLKKGYVAELPVAMTLDLGPELTTYKVIARVVGQEELATAKGRSAKAWIVEVDWLDYDTRAMSAPGGRTESGGAYFVLTSPTRGAPHVPRYENDGVTIALVVDE